MKDPKYVLITAARNEEKYIEKTIKSVVSQTNKPLIWVIVSDGSTDQTDNIVKKYQAVYNFIYLIHKKHEGNRSFKSKICSINLGFEILKNINYDLIGVIDADISFESDLFEYFRKKFQENHILGVAGPCYVEVGFDLRKRRFFNEENVPGPCQIFRRETFEQIEGYPLVKHGECVFTCIIAQMKGWKTKAFREKIVMHNRKAGTFNSSILIARLRYGIWDYYLGNHPVWELFRGIYQMTLRPYFFGGLMILLGYIWGFISGLKRPDLKEAIEFRRSKQLARIKSLIPLI